MSLPARKIAEDASEELAHHTLIGGALIGGALSAVPTRAPLSLIQGRKPLSSNTDVPRNDAPLSGNYVPGLFGIAPGVLLLASILSILQIGDLSLTLLGVSHFGPEAEGNPLLRALMGLMGEVPALASAKLLAIAIIFSLAVLARRVPWVPSALKVLIVVYLLGAIVPWSTVLLLHLV